MAETEHSQVPIPAIRTVTVFIPDSIITTSNLYDVVARASALAQTTAAKLRNAGVVVQTTRMAISSPAVFGTPELALQASKILDEADTDYVSLGSIQPSQKQFHDITFLNTILSTTSSAFVTITIANGQTIYPRLALLAAQVIHSCTPYESGLRNFRFAALANVNPGCPFFPSAYAPSTGESFTLSLGVQTASLARGDLTTSIENVSKTLTTICQHPITLDFSLAPFPTQEHSSARGITKLANVPAFPMPGCLLASARLTASIQQANFRKAGLNGIMLPVLEDVALGNASLPDLLICSAVCGTGLDAIPLPGDIGIETVQGVLLDVAALSCRLGKQLSARLVPIPGKVAGEMTEFEHEYLCNAPIVSVAEVPPGTGVREETVEVAALHSYLLQ